MQDKPGILIQEDKAPAYDSKYQQEIFDEFGVQRLPWCGNSPDFNMIEPTWFWMKVETTKKGPITSNKALKKAWVKCWEDMPQEKI
jgi:hypothetical protein